MVAIRPRQDKESPVEVLRGDGALPHTRGGAHFKLKGLEAGLWNPWMMKCMRIMHHVENTSRVCFSIMLMSWKAHFFPDSFKHATKFT